MAMLMGQSCFSQPTEIEYIASRTTGNSRGQLKDIFLYAVKLAEAQQSKKVNIKTSAASTSLCTSS